MGEEEERCGWLLRVRCEDSTNDGGIAVVESLQSVSRRNWCSNAGYKRFAFYIDVVVFDKSVTRNVFLRYSVSSNVSTTTALCRTLTHRKVIRSKLYQYGTLPAPTAY